ncbi:MAG: RNA polymerase sigma factor [Candidatus Gribaldobacteria bacterium]|nr:RNA polymerase sigma factor [Candidatus Gribaldobacteria bacterium]
MKELAKDELIALVKKAQQGDESAFGQLYEHYLAPIYRFIYFKVKNQGESEDLTQNVFVKAWKSLARYQQQPNIPFSSWLYTIARNTVIDFWKKKKAVLIDHDLMDNLNTDGTLGDLNENLELKEKRAVLRDCLYLLSDEQQEIVVLRFINDLSNQEISQILNKSEEAVRQIQYRAIKSLKEHLTQFNNQ